MWIGQAPSQLVGVLRLINKGGNYSKFGFGLSMGRHLILGLSFFILVSKVQTLIFYFYTQNLLR